MNEREAVFQRRAARLIQHGTPAYPIGISDGTAMPWERHSRAIKLHRELGGKLVHGWIIDRVTTIGQTMVALFHFHSVVRAPNGRHLDPSHLKNRTPRFLPDPDRMFDPTGLLTWNSIAIASKPITCPVTGREFPAMKPLWATHVSGRVALSMNPLHARRRMVPDGEDCTAYVAGLGLDPTSMVDVSFATNLEFSLVAYVGKPASRVKGTRLADAITLSPISPAPPISSAAIASETAPQSTETSSRARVDPGDLPGTRKRSPVAA
jgi:hypothetical protein